MNNPNMQMSDAGRLELLMYCIALGEASASKAEGQDVVMVVGNTGAGKSTYVNIIHGCSMKQYYKRGTKTKVRCARHDRTR